MTKVFWKVAKLPTSKGIIRYTYKEAVELASAVDRNVYQCYESVASESPLTENDKKRIALLTAQREQRAKEKHEKEMKELLDKVFAK